MTRLLLYLLFSLVLARPSLAEITVVGGLLHEKNLNPEDTFEGILHIRNSGERAVEVNISRADYLFSADGKTHYLDPGSNPRSNAAWLSLSSSRIKVSAGSTSPVYYAVTVPDNPDLSGTYWSVVIVEPLPESQVPAVNAQPDQVTVAIRTVVRYAVQIVTHIGDSGTGNIRFLDKKLFRQEGRVVFQTDIENIGELSLNPTVWAELYDKDGLYIGRFESNRAWIHPTCSVRHRLDLTNVPKGLYTVLLIVDNGDDHVFGANYDMRIE